jgi:ABC-type lipoprotein release transport system permease subunit
MVLSISLNKDEKMKAFTFDNFIITIVGTILGIFIGYTSGIKVAKKALTKTECVRYNPTTGIIEMQKNGDWQPFDIY